MNVLLLSLLSLAAASDAEEAAVQRVRERWTADEARIEAGSLQRATMTIGGGQNPTEVEVHYVGGSEADFERDPYAESMTIVRIVQRKVLPAVGPATASFWFADEGQLYFATTTGVDISGVRSFDLAPADELRVYYDEGLPVRVLWDHAADEAGRRTYSLRGEPTPEGNAALDVSATLLGRGTVLYESVQVLAGATWKR